MGVRTYGQLLGELILQKRRVKGLTQMQLAEDAFGTSGKTRRIVELEGGQVAKPHPKTIDPIIVTLGVTVAELEDCARRAGSVGDVVLDRAYREANNLIEALAHQFEHAKPDASLAELEDFLRARAAEWANLRDRIAAIDAADQDQSSLIASAAEALAQGDFEAADRRLAAAEDDFQTSRTLQEVRRSAELRATRGDGFLLKGDPEEALKLYLTAAEFLRPFDQQAMADFINPLAHRIYETARRSLRPMHFVASALMENLLSLDVVQSDARSRAAAAYRLSLIYRSAYERDASGIGRTALNKAIHYAALAAEYKGNADEIFEVSSVKIALANSLRDLGKLDKNPEEVLRSIEILSTLKESLIEKQLWELIAHASNSLGACCLLLAELTEGRRTAEERDKALEAFSDAVQAAEFTGDADAWGAAKANIGNILREQAGEDGIDPHFRRFFRMRAAAELSSSLESISITAFPQRFSEVQNYLGYALSALSSEFDGHLAEQYMLRSISAFEISAEVFGREGAPSVWAEAQINISAIMLRHSRTASTEIARYDLEGCLARYREALEVFVLLGNESRAALCREAVAKTESDLAELPTQTRGED